ncbi:MAG: hypothetical protein ABIC39_06380 [Pseudomonadota bacterium]
METNIIMNEEQVSVARQPHLAEKVAFIDGLGGCGKTMLSPIISALDRVELLTYAYEIEHICSLHYLGKIDNDAARMMVRMLTDLQLYNSMMSREINFRPGDLSSVFRDAKPLRYLRRLFQKGDKAIPEIVSMERPILNLTTHNLLAFSEPIFSALGDRAVFIEVVRHPLYMVRQEALNMESVVADVRDFTVYFDYKGRQLPYYISGWEELFLSSNAVDKAIYYIDKLTKLTEIAKTRLKKEYNAQILTVSFESFVTGPGPYIEKIGHLLGTKATAITRRMMKKQNVPRKMYADGIGLKVYKRCGWEPPKSSNEEGEFALRRKFAAEHSSSNAMQVLDQLCKDYEDQYLK